MPEALRILSQKLSVTSNQIIAQFSPSDNYCNDGGKITVSESYATQTTNADFILFVGTFNDASSGTLAYATYCLLGIFLIFQKMIFGFCFSKSPFFCEKI